MEYCLEGITYKKVKFVANPQEKPSLGQVYNNTQEKE